MSVHEGAGKGCPYCHDEKVTRFNWQVATSPKFRSNPSFDFGELTSYAEALRPTAPLKFGSLWRCPSCNSRWFLDSMEEFIYFIPEDLYEVVEKWNRLALQPTAAALKILMRIGTTPPDKHCDYSDPVVPCQCILKDGRSVDFCEVTFQKRPPLDGSPSLFLNEVAEVKKSEYALPYSIRKATSEASALERGFAPIVLVARDGKRFLTTGTTNFFSHDSYIGSDIVGILPYSKVEDADTLPSSEAMPITVVIADGDMRYQDPHKN